MDKIYNLYKFTFMSLLCNIRNNCFWSLNNKNFTLPKKARWDEKGEKRKKSKDTIKHVEKKKKVWETHVACKREKKGGAGDMY